MIVGAAGIFISNSSFKIFNFLNVSSGVVILVHYLIHFTDLMKRSIFKKSKTSVAHLTLNNYLRVDAYLLLLKSKIMTQLLFGKPTIPCLTQQHLKDTELEND